MSLVPFEQSYIFSSDEKNGAQNVNNDGNEFSVNLNDPLSIPKNAINCTLEVVSGAIWYVQPNVSEEIKNNNIHFTHNAAPFAWVIPDGLYALSDLNAYLSREFVAEGLPDDLFVFSGDSATQKSILTFNYAGTQIDFTVPDSVNSLLGFADLLYPQFVPSVAGESFASQDTAAFNRLSSYLIHSSLCPSGIPVNQQGSNIIAAIPITTATPPGSQLVYTPLNPIKADASNLIGAPVSSIRMRISDQADRQIDMLGEDWSVLIVVRYWLQVSDHSEERRKYRHSKHGGVY